jgi:hypothetical protein
MLSLLAIHPKPISLLTFINEVGPVLGITLGLCIGLGLTMQFFIDYLLHVKSLNHWASQHQESIQKVMMLGHLAASVREKLPPCPDCEGAEHQFWNFGRGQVTYRCTQCGNMRIIRAFSDGEVRLMLGYLPALLVVLPGLKTFQKDWIGRRLNRVCQPVATYCQRYFSRVEGRQQL